MNEKEFEKQWGDELDLILEKTNVNYYAVVPLHKFVKRTLDKQKELLGRKDESRR